MATILLSAAGAAAGASVGGSVLGLSAAVLGRAAGATVGRLIDSKILGAGSPAIERGKVDRFRLTGASEGASIARVHGRIRVAGQVIWATQFQEIVTTSGGGKGSPSLESYKLQVVVSGAVRRELIVGASEWTYTAADQSADGISGVFSIEVAQISDRFGPGLAGKVIIDV